MAAPDSPNPPDRPLRATPHKAGPDTTPGDPLGSARNRLGMAVALGTPALRSGDPRGAYEIYATTARVVVASVGDAPAVCRDIVAALDQTDLDPDPRSRATVLHTLFRGLLGGHPNPAGMDDPPDYDPADVADPHELIHGYLLQALALGEPARAIGSNRGCYEVLAASARMILNTVTGADGVLARLQGALDEADQVQAEPQKASVLRRSFEDILALNRSRRGAVITRREMRLLISMAMQIGAPAYNLGDHRGCYETYACCARLLSRIAPEPADVILMEALRTASVELDVSEQAWILRRAFDRLITDG